MPRWVVALLAAALAIGAVVPAVLAQGLLRTSPSELLANPRAFDGKPVTVSGAMVNVQERAAGGPRAYSFELSDGTQAVHVIAPGRSHCLSGRATVDGTFDGARQQVTAAQVRCR